MLKPANLKGEGSIKGIEAAVGGLSEHRIVLRYQLDTSDENPSNE